MCTVFHISDLHFGHKKIIQFGNQTGVSYRTGDDHIENMHHIITEWNKIVTKRDIVWVQGDVAFNQEGYDALFELNGRLKLVRGNHDNYFTTQDWLKRFETVESIVQYKGHWLTHAPIHPDELRGRKNIHGHCVDEHTELLTLKGWKKYSEISEGDDVYSYNSITHKLEVDTIKEFIIYPQYSGYYYTLKGKGIDMWVTDEHRVPFVDVKGTYRVLTAKEAFKRYRLDVIKSAEFDTSGVNLTDNMLRLYVALASDGHVRDSGLCRFNFHKERKFIKLCRLLEDLNISYKIMPESNSPYRVHFYLPEELKAWRIKGLDKKLLKCTKEQTSIVKETYSWTDGNRDLIFSSKKEEVDLLQHLFVTKGYSCKLHHRENHGFSKNRSYQLSVTDNTKQILTKVKDRVEKHYTSGQLVWCIRNTNQNFIARRNGSVFLTGNCHQNSIKNKYTNEYDMRYINVCCEAIDEVPIPFELIKSGEYWNIKKC